MASSIWRRLLSDSLILSLQESRPNITAATPAGIILSPGYPAQLSFCDKLTILDILAKAWPKFVQQWDPRIMSSHSQEPQLSNHLKLNETLFPVNWKTLLTEVPLFNLGPSSLGCRSSTASGASSRPQITWSNSLLTTSSSGNENTSYTYAFVLP